MQLSQQLEQDPHNLNSAAKIGVVSPAEVETDSPIVSATVPPSAYAVAEDSVSDARSSLLRGISEDRRLLARFDTRLARMSGGRHSEQFARRQQLNEQILTREAKLRDIEAAETEQDAKRIREQKQDDRQFYGKAAASGVGASTGMAILTLAATKGSLALLLGPSGLFLLAVSVAAWSPEVRDVLVAKYGSKKAMDAHPSTPGGKRESRK